MSKVATVCPGGSFSFAVPPVSLISSGRSLMFKTRTMNSWSLDSDGSPLSRQRNTIDHDELRS